MYTPTGPFSPDYFEQQYNARAAIPDHAQIFARWARDAARVRAELPCHLDLRYGQGPLQTLDIFPARGKSRSLLMYIHGGYWRSLDKGDFSFLAPALVEAGVTVAMVNYDLAPRVTVGEIAEQMREAVAWLLSHAAEYGADPFKLHVAGHSAGAHLTGMLFATNWKKRGFPSSVILGGLAVSGIYDLPPLVQTSMNQDIRLKEETAWDWSPAFLPPHVFAPLYTAVGGDESDEFKRQTELLDEVWGRLLPVREVEMPGFHHLSVIEELGRAGSPLHRACLEMLRIP